MKNQQATLEQVKRVLTTRVINYANKKISHIYEKETNSGNLAWTKSNYFLIATAYKSSPSFFPGKVELYGTYFIIKHLLINCYVGYKAEDK